MADSSSSSSAAVSGESGGYVDAAAEGTAARGLATQGCATWQRTSLMIAARHGQADVIARAMETSCSQPQLDVVDEHGNSALMIAAREGHDKVVDILVGCGADLFITNSDGKTAADLAKTEQLRKRIQKGVFDYESLMSAIMGKATVTSTPQDSEPEKSGLPPMPDKLAALLGGIKVPKTISGECPF
eukprot:TRINITY_DN93178_c0_g1_i1.p1 TRINITY_DN93178_c0_g1~~TRINITY_DN93178_c0_g1_i1.p1  ORF type:complete len:196 (-),score=46.91 TRINITY_DN93178_c0_g1_i1:30-590(-)